MKRSFYVLAVCLVFMLTACTSDTNRENNGRSGSGGYAWGEMVQKGQDDEVYCNLPVNINGLDGIVPVCHDSVYDILYYVNYGGDYCIYACKDGKTEKIAEIPAKRLFCREGRLYFMVESYGEDAPSGFADGNILQYNPVSGQVQAVIKEQASSMIVYQDGIYYVVEGAMKGENGSLLAVERTWKCYEFADGSIKELHVGKERVSAKLMSLSGVLSFVPLLIMLGAGGTMVINGEISIGIFYIFINLSGNVSGFLQNMPGIYANFRRFGASVDRLEGQLILKNTDGRHFSRGYSSVQ